MQLAPWTALAFARAFYSLHALEHPARLSYDGCHKTDELYIPGRSRTSTLNYKLSPLLGVNKKKNDLILKVDTDELEKVLNHQGQR